MAKATTKLTTATTLRLGSVEIAVGLFSTVAKPSKLAEFDTGGPNGGVLKARPRAQAIPVAAEPTGVDVPVAEHSVDPFGGVIADAIEGKRPMSDDAVLDAMGQAGPSSTHDVDGEYGRELVEEGTGIVVAPQDVRRGVRLEDGRFIDCTDRLAEIAEQTKLDSMDVLGFVDVTQVPRVRVSGAQYIGAIDDQAPRALRLLYEGLKARRRAAIVKVTKRSRQTLGVIGWHGGVLVLYELVWAEDFREPPARATRIQKSLVSEAEVAQVCALIDEMPALIGSLDELRDDAIARREALRAEAERGEVAQVVIPPAVAEEARDELWAQLEASLAAVKS